MSRIVTVIEPYRIFRSVLRCLPGAIVIWSLAGLVGSISLAHGQSPLPSAPQAQSPSGPGMIPAPVQTPSTQGSGAQAASTPVTQDQEAPTIKVQANEVDLVFTVTDKKGGQAVTTIPITVTP